MTIEKYFEASDGWLFATLKCMGKGNLKLKNILSIGDSLNHAIFTLDEINNGLSRLESEEFIIVDNLKFHFTKKAKDFIKSNSKKFELCINEQVRYSNIFTGMMISNNVRYKEYFNNQDYDMAIAKYRSDWCL